ncbi:unnamed protein product, partial [marine sediment metagenome]
TLLSPSGTKSPSTDQTIAIFDVKAEGYRDLTFDDLTLEKSGSNSPEALVTTFSLWEGTNLLARATTPSAADMTTGTTTAATAATSIVLCAGTVNSTSTNNIGGVATSTADAIKPGDRILITEIEATTTVTVLTKTGSFATCNAADAGVALTLASPGVKLGTSHTAIGIYNYRVHFDATSTSPLTEQTITAGQTKTLTVKADTSLVRTGIIAGGSASFGVSIPGTTGPLATSVNGLTWDYTPL